MDLRGSLGNLDFFSPSPSDSRGTTGCLEGGREGGRERRKEGGGREGRERRDWGGWEERKGGSWVSTKLRHSLSPFIVHH